MITAAACRRSLVDEEHACDVACHQEHHDDGDNVDEHVLVLPPGALSDSSRSTRIRATISRRRRRRSG
jgi:hypothetical protein